MTKASQILQFTQEIEGLKSTLRHSWLASGRQESVAEHTWRYAIMVMIIGAEIKDFDIGRALMMSLIHDLPELYEGDIPAFEDQSSKQVKEHNAIKKMLKILPTKSQKLWQSLWQEYEDQKTIESKIAKSVDKLEVLIQHNQSSITTWKELEKDLNLTYGQKYMNSHPVITEIRAIIDTQTKEKIEKNI